MAQQWAFVSLVTNPLGSINARTSCEWLSGYQICNEYTAPWRDKMTIMDTGVLKLKVIPGLY
jgi:hypothetical protein